VQHDAHDHERHAGITGEDCFLLELHLRDMDDLEEILDRFVLFGQTTTSIVHSSPVARRPLPLG